MISDVMGKGVPAAMFAVILRSLVRALREFGSRPGELLGRINRLLYEELSEVEMFITAQVAFIDTRSRRFVAASAGHCPILHSGTDPAQPRVLSPDGLPLGVMRDTEYAEEAVTVDRHSRLLLYTDGLTEAGNPSGELFGQKRLLQWLEQAAVAHQTASAMKAALTQELLRFQGSHNLSDDQTFLILAG
jgi:sigma-B regulation protein RsbU (phosphoserine phosphatase)